MEILSRAFTYAFILIIYLFILRIIQMVSADIKIMSSKKGLAPTRAGVYLKLLNLRHELAFAVRESYAIERDATIGRSKKCDICIDDPFLSQEHAQILVRDGGVFLLDLESTNGTFLNDEQISGDAIELFSGDSVHLGQLKFVFVSDREGAKDE